MSRRGIDLRCMQEYRWRGAWARMIDGKDARYKCFWIGNEPGIGVVGVLLEEKWIDKVFDSKPVSDRLMMIKIIVDEVCGYFVIGTCPTIWTFHSWKGVNLNLVQTIDDSETLLIWCDFNGHIRKAGLGYEGIHVRYGFGKHNKDGERYWNLLLQMT